MLTGLGSLDPLIYYYTPVQKFVHVRDDEDWRPLAVKPALEINQWGQVRFRADPTRYVTPDSARAPKAYRFQTNEASFFDIGALVYSTFVGDLLPDDGVQMIDNNPFNYHYTNVRRVPDPYVQYLVNSPVVNRHSVRALRRFKVGKPVWEVNSWIEPPVAWHASTAHVSRLLGIRVEQVAMYLAGVHSKTIKNRKLLVAFEDDPYQRWIRWHLIPAQHPVVETQGLARFVDVDPIRMRNIFRARDQRDQQLLVGDVRETLETMGELASAYLSSDQAAAYESFCDFGPVSNRFKPLATLSPAALADTRAQMQDFVRHLEATREARGWYFDPAYQRQELPDVQVPLRRR